ncbi:N-acyl homoserine lactonase family protein [Calderihabitans maritimus]|uniref:Metallo-beta-lactamase domain-containing protein n=1 Tax=Calderihabitans maritimus TaxID=1246530 RepID=A0A1Z5HVH4_9FIRM|nr:N-acyl homoserine lactonase family protein [Calderihabitans maritimus]GAW93543.1 hypothetical protein KKC1_26740 [Calderihabitans maritimus]
MAVKELFLLPCGYLKLDQSILTAGIGMGKIVNVPVYSALINTDDGVVLVDTGLNPDGLTNPERAWGSRAKVVRPILTEEDDIRNRLGQLGFSINDVKFVINTHLHWDHTGGNRFFKDCPIIVQKAEYRFALYPDSHLSSSYMENHFKHPLNYKLIEGDQEIVPGVSVITSPGHTPGHQSVIIDLPETGTVILAGDAIYCNMNLEESIPPGNRWSASHAMESIYKLKYFRSRLGGLMLPGHEPILWSQVKSSPASYC